MNLPLIDAAEYFLNLKQAAGEALPAVEEAPAEDGLLQALSEAAKSKLGLAIAYRVYSESLRDPSNSAIGEHFKEHSEDCLNDVDFFVRRSSVMSGGASLEGVESPPASGDLTEILQVLSAMEEANLSLMSELVVLLEGNPSKYEVEAMMAKDQHHLDDLTQHMPVAPELPSVEGEVPSVEEAAPPAVPPGVIGPAKVAGVSASKGLARVGELLTGSRAKKLTKASDKALTAASSHFSKAEGHALTSRKALDKNLLHTGRKAHEASKASFSTGSRTLDRSQALHAGAKAESGRVLKTRVGVGTTVAGAAGGTGALLHGKKNEGGSSAQGDGKIASMQVILQNAAAKRHHGKEKTSEMGAAAMGQHSPVAPPAPLNGAAAGQHPKLAQRTYDVGGSKRDGKAYSMHTTPDDYELSQLISSKMDGDLRGVRGKAKNEGMLVGSGLGAVKGLKAGKGWGGGEVIRTGGGGGTVIGTFGSGGKMPKGMGADIRENQGMIRDELRGQGIKIGGLAQAAQAGAGRLAGAVPHIGSALQWAAHGAAPAALAAGAAGAVGGAVAGGEGHRLSGALKGGVGAGIVGGAAGGLAGAGAHRFATRALSAAAPKLAADKIGYRWDNESDESVARYADHGSDGLRYGAPIAGGVTGALMGRTPAGRVVGALAGAGIGHLVGSSENGKLRNQARAEEIQRHQHRIARAGQSAASKKEAADKSDSELAETGRQRAVANLASGFTSDKHTSGERHGTLAGRLGGAAVGAGAGALASKGATLPVRLAAGMGGAVIGGSMGGQIGKTIGSDHDAEKFWANHKEAGAGSSAAKWLAAHPTAVGGVAGSAIGAAGGAVAGGPEHRLSGALGGAAVGGAAGATAGHVGGRLLRAAPSPAAAPVQLASGRPGTIMAGPLPSAHTAVPQNVSIGSSPTVIPSRAHSIGSSPTVIPSSSSSSSKMRNLTMEGGEEMAAQYRQMPEDLRNVVESTPLVRDHKMQPHNALGLLQSRGSWGPNWKGGTPPRVPNPAHESESAVARVLRQAAETKVGSVSHGDKEMSPVLGKRVIRNAKQVWDNAVKEAMGEEAPVEQYLQEEAAGRQAQEAAESDYLRQQLQQTSQQLEQTQAQAQEQEAQVGEMQGTIEQLQGQQAEQAQAADAAVQTARQTAEAAMSQSMQRSAELMKQTQLAAGLQNAAATMKEQLMALSQTPVPPATVGEAGELDAAAQQQVGQDQAMEEQAAMEEEAQMAAAQGAPPAAAPTAPPAAPKTASLGRAMGGAGQVLSKAPSGVAGAVLGAGVGVGTNAMIRGGRETAFLQDSVRKLEQKHQGGFATGMALAEARMRAEQSSLMDQHPGKAALVAAARGAGAGFRLDTTLRSILR